MTQTADLADGAPLSLSRLEMREVGRVADQNPRVPSDAAAASDRGRAACTTRRANADTQQEALDQPGNNRPWERRCQRQTSHGEDTRHLISAG